jgi:two-component system response regulator FixJ
MAPVSILHCLCRAILCRVMIESQSVYIVDDDAAVRDALSILVKSINLNVMEFSSADQFLDEYDPQRPGCLITDVYMPGMDGVALQKRLNDIGSQLPIIVMSGHGDIPLAVNMIRNGAFNFVEKPFSNHQMLEHIQQALKLDSERRSTTNESDQSQQYYATLTPREKEVLEFLISGVSNKVIAARMSVSPRTIETHRANVLRKMNSESVVSLVQKISYVRRISDQDQQTR